MRRRRRKTRVLIADDHSIRREALRSMLTTTPDLEVVAEARDAEEAVSIATALSPDVVLLASTSPRRRGSAALTSLVAAVPHARFVVISADDDAAEAASARAAGAVYLSKRAPTSDLLSAIADARPEDPNEMALAIRVPGPAHEPTLGDASVETGLSGREQEVLALLARGHTHSVIAQLLGINVKTVGTYRGRIAEKLGLLRRSEIISYALETGLLAPEKPH